MDMVVFEEIGQDFVLEVEQCFCLFGYCGLFCQDCDIGYICIFSGFYLGICECCSCYGYLEVCEFEIGVCQGCQYYIEGFWCEQCQLGYYGDVQWGILQDCQLCFCYGDFVVGQVVYICFLDIDGYFICDVCFLGYSGCYCERCVFGYYGNFSQGQLCWRDGQVLGFIGCNCDF